MVSCLANGPSLSLSKSLLTSDVLKMSDSTWNLCCQVHYSFSTLGGMPRLGGLCAAPSPPRLIAGLGVSFHVMLYFPRCTRPLFITPLLNYLLLRLRFSPD